MSIINFCIGNSLEKKTRLRLDKNGIGECNLKLYNHPVLEENIFGFGPTIMASKRVKKVFNRFVDTMEDNFSEKQLISFYNNLDYLVICESYLNTFVTNLKYSLNGGMNGIVGGSYNCLSNNINLNLFAKGKYYEQVITHELLHMSSSCCKGFKMYKGFSQGVSNVSVGNGLNEGYTELLNEKFFKGYNIQPNYLFLKEVSRTIENIVGDTRMQNLYFGNDLKTLRDELALYTSESSANGFILDTDIAVYKFDSYDRIINFLSELYENKINNDLEVGSIDSNGALRKYSFLKRELDFLDRITKSKRNIKEFVKDMDKHHKRRFK